MKATCWSRRRVLAVGGRGLVVGAAAAVGGVPSVLAHAPGVASEPGLAWWVVEPGAGAAPGWPAPGADVQVLVLGQRDLYAWWRGLRRDAAAGRPLPPVHGLTHWAACGLMQMCAREAGLSLVIDASVGTAAPSGVAWHLQGPGL